MELVIGDATHGDGRGIFLWLICNAFFIFKSIVITEVTTLPGIYDFALQSFGH